MTVSNKYVIGDLQGCFGALQRLLDRIEFNPQYDQLYFAGDLVARGEDSLSTLREVKQLSDTGCAKTVLGNHDITLIASWRKVVNAKVKDKTLAILQASDCDELMNWLRNQPLMIFPTVDSVLTHAGIPPHWHIAEAKGFAKEVEEVLQSSLTTLDNVLPHLYQRTTDDWHTQLDYYSRLRAITNYFTRMRLCDERANLEFDYKDGIDGEFPDFFRPWFDWQASEKRKHKIFFGHWAALHAETNNKSVVATDGGCVWGGRLVAYRLNDNKIFSVDAV